MFARKPFSEAAAAYLEERKPHVAERTIQFEKERLGPLCKQFGEKPLLRFKAEDVAAYQTARLSAGVSGRTVNMETGVLRRMLKRAKVWNAIAEDVKALPERQGAVGKVLPADLKRKLFEVAASRPEWTAAHCAAVLAVSICRAWAACSAAVLVLALPFPLPVLPPAATDQAFLPRRRYRRDCRHGPFPP